MKKILLILTFIILFVPASFAKKFQVVVLPLGLYGQYSTLYDAQNVDVIIADDVINNFNSSYKIEAPTISQLKSKIENSGELKTNVNTAISAFTKNSEPDYNALKYIANSFGAKSVLFVYSYVQEGNKPLKRDFYEMMKLSTIFELQSNYNFVTEAVLFDNVNNLVMWSALYKTPLNKNNFKIKSYNEVVEQIEKIKLYSKDILSENISENVTLRFYPKSVRPVTVKASGEKMDSGVLKFDRDIPSIKRLINRAKGKPQYTEEPDDIENDRWNEWMFDI